MTEAIGYCADQAHECESARPSVYREQITSTFVQYSVGPQPQDLRRR
jgi:hypothetical protein